MQAMMTYVEQKHRPVMLNSIRNKVFVPSYSLYLCVV